MAILKPQNKNKRTYNGLSNAEAKELHQGLYFDYQKKIREQQGQKGAKAATDAMTEVGQDYVWPAIKTAASFTPAGPAIGLMDAKAAWDRGDKGWAVAGAGLEALPYVGKVVGKVVGKGIKSGARVLRNTHPKTSFMLKSQIESVDDLLSLPDKEIIEITNMDRAFWNNVYSKKPETANKFLQNKLSPLRLNKISDAPTITNGSYDTKILTARNKQEEWLKSDEWLHRRMAATGESRQQAIVARSTMIQKLKKTEVTLKDITGVDSSVQGYANSPVDGNPTITVGVDKNHLDKFPEFANHEYIHASNAWKPEYTMKGIPFKTIENESTNPQVQKTVSYLNDQVEQQVRGVRALDYLKSKGLWRSGEVSDEAITALKRGAFYGGDTPGDVRGLVTNLDNTKLKDFLNKVYAGTGVVIGAKSLQTE